MTRVQLDEDTTEAGSQPAAKSDGFKVPPPPGYKPKPQAVESESADIPVKKVRGMDKLYYFDFCVYKNNLCFFGSRIFHSKHLPSLVTKSLSNSRI